MVAARSAAMTINRIADVRYDKENPRTARRALATGALSTGFAWMFTIVAVAVFFPGRVAVESSCAQTGTPRARHSVFLLLYQALHQLVASLSRICARHFSCCCVDRRHWAPQYTHV